MLQLNWYKTYPWLDESASYMLDNLHDDWDDLDRQKKTTQTYEQIKKEEDYNAYKKERNDYLTKIVADSTAKAKTKEQKANIELGKRTTELASYIRDLAYQQWLDYKKNTDDEAMVKFVKAYPEAKDMMTKYLNGDDWLVDYINKIRKPTWLYGKGWAGNIDNFLMWMWTEIPHFVWNVITSASKFSEWFNKVMSNWVEILARWVWAEWYADYLKADRQIQSKILSNITQKIYDANEAINEQDKAVLRKIGIDTESKAFWYWEWTTDIALSMIPTLLLPWSQALWLASKISNPVLKFMTKALINWVEGMAWMETYAMWAEWRFANAWELALWGIGWAIIPEILPAWKWLVNMIKGKPQTLEAATKWIENLAGKVFQSTDEYATQQWMKTLEDLDTSAINTYDDFANQLDTAKKWVMTEKKALMWPKWDTPIANDKLTLERNVKLSDNKIDVVRQRPFDNAMEDLKTLYEKEWDFVNYRRVEYLQNKANQWKMTLNEMDDFIVEYGQKEKAFSDKTWQPMTSTTAIARENIRTAMKDIFRNEWEALGIKWLKEVDQKYHQYSVTQKMVDKVAENVWKLQNKIKEKNIIQLLVDKWVKLVNMATGGWLKQVFSSLVPSNVWNKIMNSLDLQENLPRFLKKIDSLIEEANKIKTKEQAEKLLLNMRKAGVVEEAVTPVNEPDWWWDFEKAKAEAAFNQADLSATPKAEITKASKSEDIIKYAKDNLDDLKTQYKSNKKNYFKDPDTKEKTLILNTDNVRPLLWEQLWVESKVNHDWASLVNKSLKQELITTKPAWTKVLILWWGWGSGKGYTLDNIIKPKWYWWIEDKTFSKLSNIEDYKELVDKWFKPEIKFVYSPQDMAWNNALDRFITKEAKWEVWRKLPFKPFSEAHQWVIENIKQLQKEWIPFEVYVNRGQWKWIPEKINSSDIAEEIAKNKNLTKEEAISMAKKFKLDWKWLNKKQISALFSLFILFGIPTD